MIYFYDFFNQLLIGFIAFASNTLSALAGGGAGLIQLPSLLFLGLPFSSALATHKVASVFLGIGATTRHLQHKKLDIRFVLYILLFGLPGVFLGANLAITFPDKIGSILLGVLTLSLGFYSVFNDNFSNDNSFIMHSKIRYLIGSIGLFIIGILNGSLSSGSGLFVTILLVRTFKLSYVSAVGYTLILVGFFWNITGAIVLGLKGHIYWSWIPMLTIGSLLGGYFGAHISLVNGNSTVKKAFEFICIVVGTTLLLRSI